LDYGRTDNQAQFPERDKQIRTTNHQQRRGAE